MRNSVLQVFMYGVLSLAGFFSAAGNAQASSAALEASMVVRGHIDIATDGSVEGLRLTHEDALEPNMANFIRKAVMAWRFEPIVEDGVAVPATAPVSLRLMAVRSDDGDFRASIRGASFDVYDPTDATTVRWEKNTPPKYPSGALRAWVQGDVYLAVKVGRDGSVEDAAVRQVNLLSSDSERNMKRWREALAAASLRTARDWRFLTPTEGEAAAEPYWLVTVPVAFRLIVPGQPQNTDEPRWTAYVPGPLQPLPWLAPEDVRNATSPEALADGGVYMVGEASGPKLLTPLDPG